MTNIYVVFYDYQSDHCVIGVANNLGVAKQMAQKAVVEQNYNMGAAYVSECGTDGLVISTELAYENYK